MAIERAVVSGSLLDLVQTRSMFTCDVVPSEPDTRQLLWETYLHSIYTPWSALVSNLTSVSTYELQEYSAGSWVPYEVVSFPIVGLSTAQVLVNAVSIVLIGKATGLRHIGRKFISGLTEGIVAGNLLETGAVGNAAAALLAYITPFMGIGGGLITPGVVDKFGVFHPFAGGMVSTILGSMRKRKPGNGM